MSFGMICGGCPGEEDAHARPGVFLRCAGRAAARVCGKSGKGGRARAFLSIAVRRVSS